MLRLLHDGVSAWEVGRRLGVARSVSSVGGRLASARIVQWAGQNLTSLIPERMTNAQLASLHVLVVDDDAFIGMLVEDILVDNGCRVCGPHITFAAAMRAAETEAFDIAVLDVNLSGINSYPIGEVLAARGVPFVLISGYGDDAAPADHPDWPTCSKPFTAEALTTALRSLLK